MSIDAKTIPKLRQIYYDVYADLPTTGVNTGDLGYATDRKTLYRWSGAAWQSITVYAGAGAAADIPAAADVPDGSLYYATDTTTLKMQNGGSWIDMPKANIATGNYTGNSTADRAIPHGLGTTPSLIIIVSGTYVFSIVGTEAIIHNAATYNRAVSAADSTNFHVGHADDYSKTANINTVVYYWVAIG